MRQSLKCSQDTGGPAHIKFHFIHARTWLERNAARVKCDALAHQHHRGLGGGCAFVVQHDESQGLGRRLRHCRKRAHAQAQDFLQTQHFAGDFGMLGQGFGCLGQQIGRGVVSRPVAPFAGQGNTCNLGASHGKCRLSKFGIGHAQRHFGNKRCFGARFCCCVDISSVRSGLRCNHQMRQMAVLQTNAYLGGF